MTNIKITKEKVYYGLVTFAMLVVVLIIGYSTIYKNKQSKLKISTQYTYSVRVDEAGNVVEGNEIMASQNSDFSGIDTASMAKIWIKNFTAQFTQQYIPRSKGLKDVKIGDITVLNEDEKVVKVCFSAEMQNGESDYFSSWGGYLSEGRLTCEWIISFEMDDLYDHTAQIFVKDIQMPQDYSASRVKTTEKAASVSSARVQAVGSSSLYAIEVKNEKVLVTYDGGEKWSTVPVDYNNFCAGREKEAVPLDDSYQITDNKAVFLYGGVATDSVTVPVTIIYSDDHGVNWTTSVISDSITTVDYYYVGFSDTQNGKIVLCYKVGNREASVILNTTDGGETWNEVGRGPVNDLISGVNFIDADTGFIQYTYEEKEDTNLYMTADGGVTFSPVILEAQTLNDVTGKYTWDMVYRDIQVPVDDGSGTIYLLVNQLGDVNYDGNSTSARYESNDRGKTWNFSKIADRNAEKDK